MTTKIKMTLLTVIFHFGLMTGLQAQEKYEYAIISYMTSQMFMEISINGVEYKKIEVPKEKIKGSGDANAALEEINNMSTQGWELFDTEIGIGGGSSARIYIFYLRKKKP